MEARQIKIRSSFSPSYWYSGLEGQAFWVVDSEYNSKYKVAEDQVTDNEFLIEKSDCEELFTIGEKVLYIPKNENGMVKQVVGDGTYFVVFHCNDDWENFKDYTGQLTGNTQLRKGWI